MVCFSVREHLTCTEHASTTYATMITPYLFLSAARLSFRALFFCRRCSSAPSLRKLHGRMVQDMEFGRAWRLACGFCRRQTSLMHYKNAYPSFFYFKGTFFVYTTTLPFPLSCTPCISRLVALFTLLFACSTTAKAERNETYLIKLPAERSFNYCIY